MKEIIEQVASKVGISEEQASQAVSTVVDFIKDKLPEPIAGQIDGLLGGEGGSEGGGGILDQAKDALGGMLGGDD